jgi:predicted XRE-type DNA-binding protein/REP element-mobilizing transposase RayT
MSIISINGRISSGKDLTGKIIQCLYYLHKNNIKVLTVLDLLNDKNLDLNLSGWQVKKFADKLKDIVCILIGCTREQLEDPVFKETELGEEWWYYLSDDNVIYNYLDVDKNEYKDTIKSICKLIKPTSRFLLQNIGTDLFRDQLHPNIWCTSLFVNYTGDLETWKPIKDYEEFYEISSFGNVKSLNRTVSYGNNKGNYHTRKGQILKPTLSGGYETVSLSGKTFTVHSLVANHFVEGKQEGFVVNHIDYNKINNFYKNLEWITQGNNIKHNKTTLRGNFGESQKDSKLTDEKIIAIRKLFEDNTLSQNQIAKLFEVSPTTITDIKKGRKWNHVGKEIPTIFPITPKLTPNWIITDLRFPNEYDAVKSRGGITIRVVREFYEFSNNDHEWGDKECRQGKLLKVNADYFSKEESNKVWRDFLKETAHKSEIALDDTQFDYEIINDGSIEDLIEKVKQILITEKII